MAVVWFLYTIGIMVFYKEGKEVSRENETNEETKVLISEDHSSYGATSTNFEQQNEVQPVDLQSWSRIKKGKSLLYCLFAFNFTTYKLLEVFKTLFKKSFSFPN